MAGQFASAHEVVDDRQQPGKDEEVRRERAFPNKPAFLISRHHFVGDPRHSGHAFRKRQQHPAFGLRADEPPIDQVGLAEYAYQIAVIIARTGRALTSCSARSLVASATSVSGRAVTTSRTITSTARISPASEYIQEQEVEAAR